METESDKWFAARSVRDFMEWIANHPRYLICEGTWPETGLPMECHKSGDAIVAEWCGVDLDALEEERMHRERRMRSGRD